MKASPILSCLAFLVSGSACERKVPDSDGSPQRSEISRTTKGTEFTLKSGVALNEIRAQLGRWGAKRVDAAYELPWSTLDGKSGGYHEYHNLTDGTCLQLTISCEEAGDKVVGFAMGPPGKSYVDKLVWFSDDEKGLVKRSSSITLSGEQVVDGKPPEAPQPPR